MKRTIVLALLLASCSDPPPAPAPPPVESPTPEPAAEPAPASELATAPAPAPEVEAPPAPPAAPPMDLLHAIDARVRVSSAMSGNVAQIARLFDGDPTTAWNSETGDLSGAFIEIRLPAEARVDAIEMTAGYTRQRGARDLFRGNHRVREVRVLRDEVELGRFPLDVESQELQRIAVSGGGGTYRIELTELVEGTEPTWREACVSELRVIGTAPGAVEGAREPTTAIVGAAERARIAQAFARAMAGEGGAGALEGEGADPSEDELLEEDPPEDGALDDGALDDEALEEDAPPPEPVSDVASGSQIIEREEGLLRLTALTVAAGVEGREPVDPRTRFSRASDHRVYCHVRLENPERTATTLTMRWERVDAPQRGTDFDLNVPAQPRYVTFGATGTRGRPGIYRCVVRDEAGELLGSAAYELTE